MKNFILTQIGSMWSVEIPCYGEKRSWKRRYLWCSNDLGLVKNRVINKQEETTSSSFEIGASNKFSSLHNCILDVLQPSYILFTWTHALWCEYSNTQKVNWVKILFPSKPQSVWK